MKLLLANKTDCRFFKFWFDGRVCSGISYQGEMFLQFHGFSLHRREQAYDLGSRLLEQGIPVLIACSKKQYILGINLRSEWWKIGEEEKQRFLSEIQELETTFGKLLETS
ncbi:hypothetical protein [Myxacorys almedinensis]|uniref:Uncharacterized protein n=1 Tax=Myxacorys almedinensis A TaxID=2690445 RepID=A0A8J8CGP5_9CYAN|nr:hypothetical protein [Myxacorys almedinensis]NDJ15799.1 hypothetical protein [Myxacorys almedinensis A]